MNAAPGPTRIVISKSIQSDILNHPIHADSFTEEDVFVVRCSPQSVFRVRPATRCSASLSGHSSPILCASFSPTGALLATGSGDATARLWDLNTETPSHTLVGHKGWVLCVEWEAMERLLATGGHDGHVRYACYQLYTLIYLVKRVGAPLGPQSWQTCWRCHERPYKMGHLFVLGANTLVRIL